MNDAPTESPQQRGSLVIRTVPMPADTNSSGDIFGGWVLSQMDIAGGIAAAEVARGRVVTVAVAGMTFIAPVKVGDVLSIYCEIEKIGRTSITVSMETWSRRGAQHDWVKVTEGSYVYVALDETGNPRPVQVPA
jgi:acyl-CoA thioesterase YciA